MNCSAPKKLLKGGPRAVGSLMSGCSRYIPAKMAVKRIYRQPGQRLRCWKHGRTFVQGQPGCGQHASSAQSDESEFALEGQGSSFQSRGLPVVLKGCVVGHALWLGMLFGFAISWSSGWGLGEAALVRRYSSLEDLQVPAAFGTNQCTLGQDYDCPVSVCFSSAWQSPTLFCTVILVCIATQTFT